MTRLLLEKSTVFNNIVQRGTDKAVPAHITLFSSVMC